MSDMNNPLSLVQEYRKLVLIYEALDEKIDELIMTSEGTMENMSEAELSEYRRLARERSEVQNEMRILEQQLMIDDEDD